MANLLSQNIGTNYKSILNLDATTINTPLDATLRAVTDGMGTASPLQLSTLSVNIGGATGLNWDNTNKRLGIGTSAPKTALQVSGSILAGNNGYCSLSNVSSGYGGVGSNYYNVGGSTFRTTNDSVSQIDFSAGGFNLNTAGAGAADSSIAFTTLAVLNSSGNLTIGNALTSLGARVGVKGSGTTSATTSLLVQNSAGTAIFQIKDDMQVSLPSTATNNTLAIGGQVGTSKNGVGVGYTSVGVVVVRGGLFVNPNTDTVELYGSSNSILSWKDGQALIKDGNNGAGISNPTAILTIDSTTKGFLPPRMTTTQKNAIATPAAGLVVFDTTLNKLAVFTTAWETVTSV